MIFGRKLIEHMRRLKFKIVGVGTIIYLLGIIHFHHSETFPDKRDMVKQLQKQRSLKQKPETMDNAVGQFKKDMVKQLQKQHSLKLKSETMDNAVEQRLKKFQDNFRYALNIVNETIKSTTLGTMSQETVSKLLQNNCKFYEKEGDLFRPFVQSTWKHFNKYQKHDVTLVTQFSLGRHEYFELLLNNWEGPVSAAVYIEIKHNQELISKFVEYATSWLAARNNIDLHFVPQVSYFYPVNFLRNVAMKLSQTEYVFIVDVDFMPVPQLTKQLQDIMDNPKWKQVFVIPAFEFVSMVEDIPKSKEGLLELLDKDTAVPFRKQYYYCHASTNYDKWRYADDIYQAQWVYGYEPYIVGKLEELPLFNEHFLGRHFNKQSYALQLHANGFTFNVLPYSYILHMGQFKSDGKSHMWYRRCSRTVMDKLQSSLLETAQSHQRTLGKCDHFWFPLKIYFCLLKPLIKEV